MFRGPAWRWKPWPGPRWLPWPSTTCAKPSTRRWSSETFALLRNLAEKVTFKWTKKNFEFLFIFINTNLFLKNELWFKMSSIFQIIFLGRFISGFIYYTGVTKWNGGFKERNETADWKPSNWMYNILKAFMTIENEFIHEVLRMSERGSKKAKEREPLIQLLTNFLFLKSSLFSKTSDSNK